MSSPARLPAHVLVVSSQEVVVAGLSTLLQRGRPDWDVAEGPDATTPPDVVLYDVLELHRGDGSDLDRWVGHDTTTVIAVSRDLRPDLQSRALERGARAAISIGISGVELAAVVEAALAGALDESPVVRRLGSEPLGQEVGLSPRESAVLRLIVQGYTNNEIAEHFYLSINSIKTYIRTTYRKLGVRSRQQAVTWAIRHGFPIEREEPQSTCSPYISPSGSAMSSMRAPSGSVK